MNVAERNKCIHSRRSTTFSDFNDQLQRSHPSEFAFCCFGKTQTKSGVLFVTPVEFFLWASSAVSLVYLILIHKYEDACEYVMQEAATYIPCWTVAACLIGLLVLRGFALISLFCTMRTRNPNCMLFVLFDLTLRASFQLAICLLLTIAIVNRKEWFHKRPYLERLIILWLITCKDLGLFCLFVAYYKYICERREWENEDYEAILREERKLESQGGILKRANRSMSLDTDHRTITNSVRKIGADLQARNWRTVTHALNKDKKTVRIGRSITIIENDMVTKSMDPVGVACKLRYSKSF